MNPAALVLAAAAWLQAPAAAQQAPSAAAHVGAIEVRGNHTTPDEVVIGIAGIKPGDPFTDETLAAVKERLGKSGRFRSADVLKRYQSLTDFSSVLVVILVVEREGVTVSEPNPGAWKVVRSKIMWLPILNYEDGYGFTYGTRIGFVDVLGHRSRLSVPLTWGADRRATVEFERAFERGPLTRVVADAGTWRRENPAFDDEGDHRTGATVLAERAFSTWFRAGATGSAVDVHFGSLTDSLQTLGAVATIDTRRDPLFPRNAVYASGTWERLWFGNAPDTSRVTGDVRGFVGLFRSTVLAVRAQASRAADALPPFEQALLGGAQTVRGFPLGFRAGDRLAAGTLEIRMPVSSPRNIGRAGIAVFADTGTIYDTHTTIDHAKWDTGIGAGWFLQLPILSFRLDVAHGLDSGTRAHVTFGVTF